jgi:hypothetical protein
MLFWFYKNNSLKITTYVIWTEFQNNALTFLRFSNFFQTIFLKLSFSNWTFAQKCFDSKTFSVASGVYQPESVLLNSNFCCSFINPLCSIKRVKEEKPESWLTCLFLAFVVESEIHWYPLFSPSPFFQADHAN